MRTKKHCKTKFRRIKTRRVNTRKVNTRNRRIKTIKYKGGNDKMSEHIDNPNELIIKLSEAPKINTTRKHSEHSNIDLQKTKLPLTPEQIQKRKKQKHEELKRISDSI